MSVVNAGLNGETTAGGPSRLPSLLRTSPDVLILELGANDGLRGLDPAVTKENLRQIIEMVRSEVPGLVVILAGMQVPPSMGAAHATAFRGVYVSLHRETGVILIPFILAGVGGNPSLNLSDGIHPNAAGHRIIADLVWETLAPQLHTRLLTTQPHL